MTGPPLFADSRSSTSSGSDRDVSVGSPGQWREEEEVNNRGEGGEGGKEEKEGRRRRGGGGGERGGGGGRSKGEDEGRREG